MKRITQFFIFLITISTTLVAQNGLHVVDSLNMRHGGPGPNYGFYFASCWGYVAPDGHEYALIGCYSGTSIIDLETRPIHEVAYIPGSNSEWKEVKTWGHYAYVVSEASQGVQIIDLQYLPDSAHFVRTITSVGGRNVTRNHTVTVADGYLYLNGSANVSPGGTVILSLVDPENPTFVGQYEPEYLHDVYVRRDTLYGAAINGGGVYVASVINKASPQLIGRVTYTGSGTHNTWASVNGRILFTTDEVGSTQKNLKVWDISNLPTVTPLTPYTYNPTTVIHNVHGRGYFAYISHYKSGVVVADVHNPAAVTTAGFYNTYRGGGLSASYAGCWGVYPYFPSGRIIGSDTQTGLSLMQFDGLLPRSRSPLLAPADGDSGGASGSIGFRWRAAANQTEDPHYYKLHIFGPGVDTLLRANDTASTIVNLPGFQFGQTYRWHVWIMDEFTSVSSQDTFRFIFNGNPVSVRGQLQKPNTYRLQQSFPNPFNPTTTIRYQIAEAGFVSLKVYNILGKEVATLVNDMKSSGEYAVSWNAGGFPSGVYIYRLQANRLNSSGFVETKRMVLLK